MAAEAITLTRRDDGTVELMGDWPAITTIAYELLEQADPALLKVEGDRVLIEVANGRAEYEITGRGILSCVAELRQSERLVV